LINNFITPKVLLYIRTHGDIPGLSEKDIQFQYKGTFFIIFQDYSSGNKTKFNKHYITSVLLCSGNRREEFNNVKGIPWKGGAIGNITWGGCRLKDVIEFLSSKENIEHVKFIGHDIVQNIK
jgi:sulfite oxidase